MNTLKLAQFYFQIYAHLTVREFDIYSWAVLYFIMGRQQEFVSQST